MTLMLMLALSGGAADRREPDFYLLMAQCSTTVGYFVQSDESLRTVEGTPVTDACWRLGRSVSCQLAFDDQGDGISGNRVEYSVILDSPPVLMLGDQEGGDLFIIDTTEHAAVGVTRVLDAQFAGAKVCQGLYVTHSEIEALGTQH